jgi:lathosterol oxidase
MLEDRVNKFFGDDDPSSFGTGWWSGVASMFFGVLGFGAVLCLHFPNMLTFPDLRPQYPMPLMRAVIQATIFCAFFLGVVSAALRKKKVLGATGILLALAATILGGASVPINDELTAGPALGLDWFLLDSLMMVAIYVPIERLWPRYPEQSTFRKEWTLDVGYWLSTHLPIQILSFLIVLPSTMAERWLAIPAAKAVVGSLPWLVQFPLAVLVADLAQMAIHATFHKVRFLWGFHSIHHSSKALDWIAGSRTHFVDLVVGRGMILLPLMFLGFTHSVIIAYLAFVTIHATWTHCNSALHVTWLEKFLVMPRHHHWHHAAEEEAIDKNFAIHFPWLDKLFGTEYDPGRWPKGYGLVHTQLPTTFWGQFFAPFRSRGPKGVTSRSD